MIRAGVPRLGLGPRENPSPMLPGGLKRLFHVSQKVFGAGRILTGRRHVRDGRSLERDAKLAVDDVMIRVRESTSRHGNDPTAGTENHSIA
jgi:hypothetical protein